MVAVFLCFCKKAGDFFVFNRTCVSLIATGLNGLIIYVLKNSIKKNFHLFKGKDLV